MKPPDEVLARARAVVAQCAHPGWTFGVGWREVDGSLCVDATRATVDSRGGGDSRGGAGVCGVADDETTIVRAAHDAMVKFTTHEVGEFFTYRGERVFDPHAVPA